MVDFSKFDRSIAVKISKQINGTELIKKQSHIYMIWYVELQPPKDVHILILQTGAGRIKIANQLILTQGDYLRLSVSDYLSSVITGILKVKEENRSASKENVTREENQGDDFEDGGTWS